MNELDLDGDGNGYSGTFRWKATKKLMSLPKFIGECEDLNYNSWMEFFSSRGPARSLVHLAQSDLSLVDCLSSPLSICFMLTQLGVPRKFRSRSSSLNLVCIGCSAKAEERMLRETNCWEELCNFFYKTDDLQLHLVGPEISATCRCTKSTSNFTANLFQGSSIDFFRSHSQLFNDSTIVIGLNCGFGNFENPLVNRYDLLLSWLPDLLFLTGTQLPLLFTCANDYADLIGEVSIMLKLLGANFVLLPNENPFGYASTLVSERNQLSSTSENGYSRGNSFYYGVQGSTKNRRKRLNVDNRSECLALLLEALSVKSICKAEHYLVPFKFLTQFQDSPEYLKVEALSISDENRVQQVVQKEVDIACAEYCKSSSSVDISTALNPSTASVEDNLTSKSSTVKSTETNLVISDNFLSIYDIAESVEISHDGSEIVKIVIEVSRDHVNLRNRIDLITELDILRALQVSVSYDGIFLLLEKLSENQMYFTPSTQSKSAVHRHKLCKPFIHNQLKAKYSKKKRAITITAPCKVE